MKVPSAAIQEGTAGNLLNAKSSNGWNCNAMPLAHSIVYRNGDSLIVLERTIGALAQIQVFFGDDIAITKDDSAGDRGPRVYGVRREFPTASSSLESAGSYALLVCCL